MGKSILKKLATAVFFIAVMLMTVYVVFNGQDMDSIGRALSGLSGFAIITALVFALCYTSCEGYMIWLMTDGKRQGMLLKCIGYAFIGFFYSGITPSASGGQPMQLYYMKRDGFAFSKSCATLTVVAAANKLVLASMGIILLIFWNKPLHIEFEGYVGWYYLGLLVLVGWVMILGFLLFGPNIIERAAIRALGFLEKIHILKPSDTRNSKVRNFFDGYREIMTELESNRKKLVKIVLISYVQRAFLVCLTYVIYKGFGLSGTSALHIILVQLAIMIAVDMLPLPGAQGISEFLYKRVFAGVFLGEYLTASMCVTRLASFYFLLFVGLGVVVVKGIRGMIAKRRKA